VVDSESVSAVAVARVAATVMALTDRDGLNTKAPLLGWRDFPEHDYPG
jgi:hypothetical protein